MDSINEMDDKFADAAKKSIAAAKEYQAYLNYEDVQKELETAKEELTRLRSELQQKTWTKIDGINYPLNTLLIVWNGTYNFAHFNTDYNKWMGLGTETSDTRNLIQFPPTHFMQIPEQPKLK